MAFRFLTILAFVVLISLAGVALEKKNLELRREISRQRYRAEVLRELHTAERLRTQEAGSLLRGE